MIEIHDREHGDWDRMTEYQRNLICRNHSLSQAFIDKYWYEMTEWQRNGVCCDRTLSQAFVDKYWNEMTEWQKDRFINSN